MRTHSFIGQHIAAESIDFQSPVFFKELTVAFETLKGGKREEALNGEAAGSIAAIIKHHTNLNVTLNLGEYVEPSVEIPAVNKNNPMINSFVREYLSSSDGLKMISEAGGAARGKVNLKTGKVSGIFAEVASTIHMPVDMVVGKKYSAEEQAAIVLHEVGHLLTYYEYIARSVTTNQVLAGLSKALDGSSGVEEREAVLIGAKKALSLNELDTKALAKSSSKKIAEVVVITNVVRQTESELGSNVYDFSTWEMLADQYVTRFGGGRHLVTALDKIYRFSGHISFRSLPLYLAMEAAKLLMILTPIPGLSVLFFLLDGAGDGTYDRPGARYQRVRNQIVENLKQPKLSKDDRARLQADLATIDELSSKVNDRRQLVGIIWDTIVPGARRAYNQERLQRQLEDLAANDLFVKAAELKQLA